MFKPDFLQPLFCSKIFGVSLPSYFIAFFFKPSLVFFNFRSITVKNFNLIFRFFRSDIVTGSFFLFDFWAVDVTMLTKYFSNNKFALYYLLFNVKMPQFRIVGAVNLFFSHFYTLTNIYWSANWLEREVFDLFGIRFFGHPDLRRILTDYGFVGNPLLKSFPLSGYSQVRYDEDLKIIISEPAVFNQKYRYFDFTSIWR